MEKDDKKGAWRVSASADTSGSFSLGTHWKCVCVCVFVVCVLEGSPCSAVRYSTSDHYLLDWLMNNKNPCSPCSAVRYSTRDHYLPDWLMNNKNPVPNVLVAYVLPEAHRNAPCICTFVLVKQVN